MCLKFEIGYVNNINLRTLGVRACLRGTTHLKILQNMAWQLTSILAQHDLIAVPPVLRQKPKKNHDDGTIFAIRRPGGFAGIKENDPKRVYRNRCD